MTVEQWTMIVAVLLGPIAAVTITLLYQRRSEKRERRLTLFRHLLAFGIFPSDANFSHAINLIQAEFADEPAVLKARRDFLEAAHEKSDDDEALNEKRAIKQVRLVYEIAKSLGFTIRETDSQTEGYAAEGFVKRDLLIEDGHRAWRELRTFFLFRRDRLRELSSLRVSFGFSAFKRAKRRPNAQTH